MGMGKWSAALALLLCATGVQAQSAEDVALSGLIERLTDRSAGAQRATSVAEDGTISVELGEGFQHVSLAVQESDGNLRAACVGSVGEANHFFGRNLLTGGVMPQPKQAPDVIHDMAGLHGMTPEEYAFYWSLIEQAEADARPKQALASTITIINNDGAGEGFNDATFATPEGGNSSTTRGGQRINVFNRAAQIWAGILDSTVTINVRANFDPIAPCTASGGVLGSAGPLNLHRNFANAPFSNTWYVAALANKVAGSDLSAANPEIGTTFNSDVDNGCLGAGSRFYYGLDNATPSGRVNLLVVVLHEIGHGLGFLTATNADTGAFNGGFPDIWARFMYDRTQNNTWLNLTQAQRAASARNNNNLLWDGPNVKIASGFLTAGRDAATGRVELYSPATFEGGSSVSHWNTRASPNLLMEPSINTGLPLTTDLTRQLFRDIGWFRDANNDGVADAITNVQPSGGTLTPGANVNITWTNTAGLNARNVTIELSTDGGATFPTTIATDVANTGSRAWTVPNIATTQGRIRVREHDYVAPLGASAANITIGANTAPSFTPAAAISRQQGSPSGVAVTVGTVSDTQTAAGSLTVTQVAGGTATGISVSNIVNSNGTITAQLAASCTATAGTVRFQVSDGSLAGTGNLQVNISANTAPTLSYGNASVASGAGTTVNPATGPADNGSVTGIVVQSSGTYTGTRSVNATTGVVTLSNAAPVGTHTITLRATDNCGTTRDATLQLTVNSTNTAPSFTPAAAISRQQGSTSGAAVTVGTVSDAQTAAGSLTVTQVAGGTATGITVSSIVNSSGSITAQLAASCTATAGTVRFQVSDGSLTGTGNLQVNISANTAPTLSYGNASVTSGAGTTVSPATGPSDNGSITGIVVQSSGTYTGTRSVNATSGVVTVSNAAPVGTHTITLRATDNCGATRDASFQLSVTAAAGPSIFKNGFE